MLACTLNKMRSKELKINSGSFITMNKGQREIENPKKKIHE